MRCTDDSRVTTGCCERSVSLPLVNDRMEFSSLLLTVMVPFSSSALSGDMLMDVKKDDPVY